MKEADAAFGPKRYTPNRRPRPSPNGITFDKWLTLVVEIGLSQPCASLETAARFWCNYPGIQYILLMKISKQGRAMRYALYDIAVQRAALPTVLPAVPTQSGRLRRRNRPHTPEIISFDMHRILAIDPPNPLPLNVSAKVDIDVHVIWNLVFEDI